MDEREVRENDEPHAGTVAGDVTECDGYEEDGTCSA